MKNVLIVLGVAAGAYFLFRYVKKKAAESKTAATSAALSGSQVIDPHSNAVVSWTPYGPKAGT